MILTFWIIEPCRRIYNSFFHLKPVGISIKLSFWIKSIIKFPINNDIFIDFVIHRNWVQFYVKLNQFWEQFWWKSHLYNCLFSIWAILLILECNRPLVNELTLLIYHILSIDAWVRILSWSCIFFWRESPNSILWASSILF